MHGGVLKEFLGNFISKIAKFPPLGKRKSGLDVWGHYKVTTFNSNTQIAYKTIATPFTLALDIASIPFAMIIMIFAGAGMSSR